MESFLKPSTYVRTAPRMYVFGEKLVGMMVVWDSCGSPLRTYVVHLLQYLVRFGGRNCLEYAWKIAFDVRTYVPGI